MDKKKIGIIIAVCIIIVAYIFDSSDSDNTSKSENQKKEKLSSAQILVDYDWCWPDCSDPTVAFKFHSQGTFNSTTKAFNIGTREGTWEDAGGGKVNLNYYDGQSKPTLTIISNTEFKIGESIYKRD